MKRKTELKEIRAWAIVDRKMPDELISDKYIGRVLIYRAKNLAEAQCDDIREKVIPVTVVISISPRK